IRILAGELGGVEGELAVGEILLLVGFESATVLPILHEDGSEEIGCAFIGVGGGDEVGLERVVRGGVVGAGLGLGGERVEICDEVGLGVSEELGAKTVEVGAARRGENAGAVIEAEAKHEWSAVLLVILELDDSGAELIEGSEIGRGGEHGCRNRRGGESVGGGGDAMLERGVFCPGDGEANKQRQENGADGSESYAADEVSACAVAGDGESAAVTEDDVRKEMRQEAPLRLLARDGLRDGSSGLSAHGFNGEHAGGAGTGGFGTRELCRGGDDFLDHVGADAGEVEAAKVGVGIEMTGAKELDEVSGEVVAQLAHFAGEFVDGVDSDCVIFAAEELETKFAEGEEDTI